MMIISNFPHFLLHVTEHYIFNETFNYPDGDIS
jgi:hypothetical protein